MIRATEFKNFGFLSSIFGLLSSFFFVENLNFLLKRSGRLKKTWSTFHLEWSERLKGSWSTYHLERSERLKGSWSTYHLERSEGIKESWSTYHLKRSERLKGYWSTYHFERNEKLKWYRSTFPLEARGSRNLCEPKIANEFFINLSPREILVNQLDKSESLSYLSSLFSYVFLLPLAYNGSPVTKAPTGLISENRWKWTKIKIQKSQFL